MAKTAKTLLKIGAMQKAITLVPLAAGAVSVACKSFARDIKRKNKKKKGEITMKKSTVLSIIVFLSAVAGALGAAYLYLRRREKELDEYEQMLFSEDYEDTDDGFCSCGDECCDECCDESCDESCANAPEEAPKAAAPEVAE